MNITPFVAISLSLSLSACRIAAPSDPYLQDFNPRYYEDWSCADLKQELAYVLGRLKQRHHGLKSEKNEDLALTATGLALFPPALALVRISENEDDRDYAALVKSAQGISRAARDKSCPGIPEIIDMEASS